MNDEFSLLLSLAGHDPDEIRGFASETELEEGEIDLLRRAAGRQCGEPEFEQAVALIARNATALDFFAELLPKP